MKFQSWKKNQGDVLPELRRVALGSAGVRMIALNDRVALGLPRDRELAEAVIRLYRPMKWKARVCTALVEFFTKLGFTRFLGEENQTVAEPEISWMRGLLDVGFLGCNPSHGIRCVLLSQTKGESIKVTKLAIGGNLAPVIAEAENLKSLQGRYEGISEFGDFAKGNGWAAFWTEHVAEKGPQTISSPEVISLLKNWLKSEEVELRSYPWVKSLCESLDQDVRDELLSQIIRTALVHGDFTPWNLRQDKEGLVAVDWEWAEETGVGGLDLGHGFLMEALFLNELRGEALVSYVLHQVRGTEFESYLKACGWKNLNLWLLFSIHYSENRSGEILQNESGLLQDLCRRSMRTLN